MGISGVSIAKPFTNEFLVAQMDPRQDFDLRPGHQLQGAISCTSHGGKKICDESYGVSKLNIGIP